MAKGGRGDVKEGEAERARWLKYDLRLRGVFRAQDADEPLRPSSRFHAATPRPEHADQNNMAERWAPAINANSKDLCLLLWHRPTSESRAWQPSGDCLQPEPAEDKITISKSL